MHGTALISIYDNFFTKKNRAISIDEALSFIKDNPNKSKILKARQKGKTDAEVYKVRTFAKGKRTQKYNFYEWTKANCPLVTWSACFDGRKLVDNIEKISGAIYLDFDYDQFQMARISKESAKNSICGFPFVKAVWDSFGADGIGAIAIVNGLTKDNFVHAWRSIQEYFESRGLKIRLDAATKNVGRNNTLSYDPNIFIREDSEIEPFEFDAFLCINTPNPQTSIPVKANISNGLGLNTFFKNLMSDPESWKNGHVSYLFFVRFFSFSNKIGYSADEAIRFLGDQSYNVADHRNWDEISEIADQIYAAYKTQHATIEIKKTAPHPLTYKGDWALFCKTIAAYYASNIKAYASTCCKRGIPKHFAENIWNLTSGSIEDNDSFDAAYKDSLFGSLVVYSSSQKENIQKKLEEKWAKDGALAVRQDLDDKKALSVCHAKSKGLKASYKSIVKFAVSVKAEGVSKEICFSFVDSADFDQKDKIKDIISIVYDVQPWLLGFKRVKEKILEINIDARHELLRSQKLSDLNLQLGDNTLLWADTNMGKTTWVCKFIKSKRIILVPIVTALQAIEEKYKASVYYEDKKNVEEGDDLIVCTYASFQNLLFKMQSWNNSPISAYELYFDEQHNLAVSTDGKFRNKEINFVVDHMHLFKKRVFLTGTLVLSKHPAFKDFKIVRVKWAQTPVKNATVVYYKDMLQSLISRLSRNGKNIVYLQNKREESKLGELVDFLKLNGFSKIQCFNADQKDTEHFQKLATQEVLDDDLEVAICTSVTIEAVNILNKDVKTLHFLTFEHPVLLEQEANRMRLVLPERIYLYKKHSTGNIQQRGGIDIDDAQDKIIEEMEQWIQLLQRPLSASEMTPAQRIMNKNFKMLLGRKSGWFRKVGNHWGIDYLGICHSVFMEEKAYAYSNIEFTKKYLINYGWEFAPDEIDQDEKTKEVKNELDGRSEERKQAHKEKVSALFSEIKSEGEEHLLHLSDESYITHLREKELPEQQTKLRFRLKRLSDMIPFDQACNVLEQWIDDGQSEKRWNVIAETLTTQSVIHNVLAIGAIDNNDAIMDAIVGSVKRVLKKKSKDKANLFLSNRQVEDIIVAANKKHKFMEYPNTQEAASLIALVADISFGTDSETGIIGYHIWGLRTNNDVLTVYSKIHEWAADAMSQNKLFTSDELRDVVNNILSGTIFLKRNIATIEAMSIIQRYVSIKQHSKRIVNGKRLNTYKVSNLAPEAAEGLSIKQYEIVQKIAQPIGTDVPF